MPASVPTDEIYERYLKKAISEINELGDELARQPAGCVLRILGAELEAVRAVDRERVDVETLQ